jgi:outer membrane protein, multidrug efflux system
MKRLCALLLTASLSAGCAVVGPNYRRPDEKTPEQWKTQVDPAFWQPAVPRDEESPGPWWDVFDDAALTELERQALEANQDIRQAAARVEQARALARVSRADLFPSAATNPSYSRFKSSAAGFGGEGSFEGKIYNLPFDLSYEVDLWGKVRRSFEASRAEAEASLAQRKFVELAVTADVARRYFELRQLDAEAELLRQALDLRGKALEIARQRASGGLVSELDVERAKTEWSAAESELFDVQRRRAETENALAVLCGRNASDFKVDIVPLTAETPLPEIPPGLPSQLLERRPDVAEAERRLASASARIGVAHAAFFPSLRLTGSAGYVSTELDSLLDPTSEVWSISPSVSLPIFAGGRNVANLDAAAARYDEAFAVYREQVLVAFADTENALANLQWLGQQARAQADFVDAARRSASISDERYRQGLVGYLESVDAERQRLQAERGAVQILSSRLVSSVFLIKALGGDWRAEDDVRKQLV